MASCAAIATLKKKNKDPLRWVSGRAPRAVLVKIIQMTKKNARTLWWVSGRVDHSGPQKIRGPPLVGQRAGAEGGPRIVLWKTKMEVKRECNFCKTEFFI